MDAGAATTNHQAGEAAPTVTCHLCKRTYRAIFVDKGQGDDCASCAWRKDDVLYLQGYYGSSHFDTYRFKVVAPVDGLVDGEPVCDDCVAGLVSAGKLQRVDGCFIWS